MRGSDTYWACPIHSSLERGTRLNEKTAAVLVAEPRASPCVVVELESCLERKF